MYKPSKAQKVGLFSSSREHHATQKGPPLCMCQGASWLKRRTSRGKVMWRSSFSVLGYMVRLSMMSSTSGTRCSFSAFRSFVFSLQSSHITKLSACTCHDCCSGQPVDMIAPHKPFFVQFCRLPMSLPAASSSAA